jgi:rubrerythrin
MKTSMVVFGGAIFLMLMTLGSCTNNVPPQNEMKQPAPPAEQQANNATEANAASEVDGNDEEENESGDDESKQKIQGSALSTNFNNLREAYTGETTASAKYAAFSKKAEEEGQHAIAMLFKAVSASEKVHASNHKAVLEAAGQTVPMVTPQFTVLSTRENLKSAIEGESYEITTMYPQFIRIANGLGDQFSLASLNYAYKVEQKHKPLYQNALAALEAKTSDQLPSVYYICPTCGNTYENTAPKRCGIFMTGSDKFIRISSLTS